MPQLLRLELQEPAQRAALAALAAPGGIETPETLLSRPTLSLCHCHALSGEAVDGAKLAVARSQMGRSFSALHWLDQAGPVPRFATGSAALDTALGGGVAVGHVTDVVGPPAAGKTQLCLTAAMRAALGGHEVIYLDTTNGFTARHLSSLGLALLRREPGLLQDAARVAGAGGTAGVEPAVQGTPPTAEHLASQALHRVRVLRAYDAYAVLDVLHAVEQHWMQEGDAATESTAPPRRRLLVVDSITAVIAPLMGKHMAAQGMMHTVAAQLWRLASAAQNRCGVIVTNHTVAGASAVDGNAGFAEPDPRTQPLEALHALKPALGISWTFQASRRIALLVVPPDAQDASDSLGDASRRPRIHGVALITKGGGPQAATAQIAFSVSRAGFGDA